MTIDHAEHLASDLLAVWVAANPDPVLMQSKSSHAARRLVEVAFVPFIKSRRYRAITSIHSEWRTGCVSFAQSGSIEAEYFQRQGAA